MLWYVPNIVILITKTILTKDFFFNTYKGYYQANTRLIRYYSSSTGLVLITKG